VGEESMETRELRALRKIMGAFILADAKDIILIRIPKIPSGNGGFIDGTPEYLSAQKFRLVPFKRRLGQQEVNTQDGDIPFLKYVLVGFWDCDVERDDTFTFQDRNCLVVGVEPKSSDGTDNDRVVVEFDLR
jgi:hypothetical protein